MTSLTTRATWSALSAARLRFRAEEAMARGLNPTRVEPVTLRSPAGYPLPARIHLHANGRPGPSPAVLLCPGGLDGLDGGEGLSVVLGCQRLARAGFAAMCWSPSGREGAPGREDRNGPLHQAEAAAAMRVLVQHPAVDPDRVVILTISFGLVLGLAAASAGVPVRGLIDWEGPPSRRWFVASRLNLESRPEDDAFWTEREPVRSVARLTVPYWRAQGRWDHVHGADTTLALEMVDAARAAGVPDVRLNGRDTWSPPTLLPSSMRGQSAAMLGWVHELTR